MENILHCCEWKLEAVDSNLKIIKNAGYTAILVGPIQKCKEGWEWWKLYQPYGFSIGNKLGSKEDLKRLCDHARFLGIKIILDVVVDHVASDEKLNLVPHEKVDSKLRDNIYFWKPAIEISNWNDRNQVINLCPGLPTLNLSNYELQDMIKEFFNELLNIGICGLRIDSAKSISLPEENGNHFFSRVIKPINERIYIMSELIFVDEKLLDMYSKYTKVLTENQNYHNKERLCTFSESHDSYYEFKSTAAWKGKKLIEKYREAASKNSDIIQYVRPIQDDDNSIWKHPEIIEINKSRL